MYTLKTVDDYIHPYNYLPGKDKRPLERSGGAIGAGRVFVDWKYRAEQLPGHEVVIRARDFDDGWGDKVAV